VADPIITLERFAAIIDNTDRMTQRMYEYIEELTRQVNQNIIATGTGSPEGVLTATAGKLYMDSAGAPGTILYVKQTGTGNTGWTLV